MGGCGGGSGGGHSPAPVRQTDAEEFAHLRVRSENMQLPALAACAAFHAAGITGGKGQAAAGAGALCVLANCCGAREATSWYQRARCACVVMRISTWK